MPQVLHLPHNILISPQIDYDKYFTGWEKHQISSDKSANLEAYTILDSNESS